MTNARWGHRRTEAAGSGVAIGGRTAHCGGGRASDGKRRTSALRRTASDVIRDEHGVAGAGDANIVTAPSVVAGDTVRAAQSLEPSSNRPANCIWQDSG